MTRAEPKFMLLVDSDNGEHKVVHQDTAGREVTFPSLNAVVQYLREHRYLCFDPCTVIEIHDVNDLLRQAS